MTCLLPAIHCFCPTPRLEAGGTLRRLGWLSRPPSGRRESRRSAWEAAETRARPMSQRWT